MEADTKKSANRGGQPAVLPDPWTIIHFFMDHLVVLVLAAALGVGAALLYLKTRPAVFVSRAVLEVAENPLPRLEADAQARPVRSDLDSSALLRTIEQTLVGQSVLHGVIEKLDLARSPHFVPSRAGRTATEAELIATLRRQVDAELVRGTRLIVVSARAGDPEQARLIAQTVLDVFFAQKAGEHREHIDHARNLLLAEARRLETEVRAAEERLQTYRETHDAVSLLERHDIVLRRLGDLNEQATAARGRRIALEAEYAQVKQLLAQGPLNLLDMREIALREEVVDLRRQLNLRAAEVATYARRYRDKHPTMIQATENLRDLQSSLETALENAGNAYLQAYQSARASEEALDRELRRQETAAMELSRLAIPYRTLEREARSYDALHQQVLARLKANDLSLDLIGGAARAGRIHVIGQPLAPASTSGMSAKVLLALGLAGGLGLGTAGAVARRALDTSLDSVDEAENYLGIGSLAVVPLSGSREDRHAPVVLSRPATLEAEAFRTLRTSLSLLDAGEDEPPVVLFTSALQGEGKSYCSLNYAAAVAQQGRRTLLIDADVRRSWLRARYTRATHDAEDFSDCLRDPSRLESLARSSVIPGLFVLGNAHGSAAAAELLSGPAFARLLKRARLEYDHIVVDTAPVTAVGDTLCLAPRASRVCLVVRARHTPRRLVRRTCQLLGRTPDGIVFNQTRRGRSANYAYYSSGEHYFQPAPSGSAAAR